MTNRFFYLEPLAIVFSLTYAQLMWSCVVAFWFPVLPIVTMTDFLRVCGFFVAVLLFSFQNVTAEIRVFVGAASGLVTVLVIFCIVYSWDSGIDNSEMDELEVADVSY